jgi:hypothetical protein
LSIFLGNIYYSFQASKVAMKTGNMGTCAQPYGINTPGAMAKTFGVLLVAYRAELAKFGDDPTTGEKRKAMEIAWSLACCANFLGGLFEFLGSFIAPLLAKNCPQGAFLAPIAGIGVTWLGINPVIEILSSHISENPIVGFLPFIIMWISFFGTNTLFGKYVPAVGVAAVLGVGLNLLAQTKDFQTYVDVTEKSFDHFKWNGLSVPNLGYMSVAWTDYGNIVLGLACTNFIGTYACTISARKAGDVYSPMESMLVDGLGSMIGALLGSPYGTTVYIGHVAYKKMGATRGYSVLNGILWLAFGLFGIHGFLNAIIPHEIVAGVIVLIGFSMASQCIQSVPPRWYAAVLVGIVICFGDYITNSGVSKADFRLLGNGYVFLSFLYTFFLMMLTDRWFLAAAGVFLALLLCALVGLIHADQVSAEYNEWGTLHGSEGMYGRTSGRPGWKFIVMYGSAVVIMLLLHLAQRMGHIEEPEVEDYREIQRMDAEASDEQESINREKGNHVETANVQTQEANEVII